MIFLYNDFKAAKITGKNIGIATIISNETQEIGLSSDDVFGIGFISTTKNENNENNDVLFGIKWDDVNNYVLKNEPTLKIEDVVTSQTYIQLEKLFLDYVIGELKQVKFQS